MIHAMKPKQRYYKKAYHVRQGDNITDGRYIKYKVLSELRKRYQQGITNLLTNNRSYAIVTNNLPKKGEYKPGEKVYIGHNSDLNEATEWYIKNCFRYDFASNEQSKRYVKTTIDTYWVLELE